ncbi:MAG: bifunctional isocitrate dehydrogenase kinase/phosphatase [Desulfobacterales bacterium]
MDEGNARCAPRNSALANQQGAEILLEGFERYQSRFMAITARAAHYFVNRDWPAMRADAVARLDLYPAQVRKTVQTLTCALGDRHQAPGYWAQAKDHFARRISSRDDRELAETFFNSVVRILLNTIGADPDTAFVQPSADSPSVSPSAPIYRTYGLQHDTPELVRRILADYAFGAPFAHLEQDAAAAARRIDTHLERMGTRGGGRLSAVEMIPAVFYRGMGAYLVGRMRVAGVIVPLVFSLLHPSRGIVVDAVLSDEDTVTVLFSFTRAYFKVAMARPGGLVAFIQSLLPRKRVAEIYTTLGYHKHGKTELYRELTRHLATCCWDQFDFSKGKHGMVMIVFNMPKDDLVFKVIREKIALPKQTNREQVMAKYDLVFHHDRAGRLIDAQSFEHLSFNRCCFTPRLLEEMQREAAPTVRCGDEAVVIEQLYVERRVIPLDIYIQTSAPEDVAAAVIDYGQAIKDLAVSNIFPGDLLLKNFGVTSQGRVVFYDYDELVRVSECVFRKIPKARSYEDELRDDPWYFVGENDVFPEELARFLGLSGELRAIFMSHHADLFDADYWTTIQARLKTAEPIHIFPYGAAHRIGPPGARAFGYRSADEGALDK